MTLEALIEQGLRLGWDTEVQAYTNTDGKHEYRVVINEQGRQENGFYGFGDTAKKAFEVARKKRDD